MPDKPPRPKSLDDGWDLDDEPPPAPKDKQAETKSGSPTRGGTLSYEELRAAGVATPDPEPMPDPSVVRGGTLTWKELLGDAPSPPPPKPPAAKADKPTRGGTRNIDELLAKTPPLPPRPVGATPPVQSVVRQGTRTWGDPKPDRQVKRLRTPSAVRGGTRPLDELVQKRPGAGGLDDLPVGDVLERMTSEPPSRPRRDDDAPSIEIVDEESIDLPLEDEDDDEAGRRPK